MSDKSVSVAAWEALFRAQVAIFRELNHEFPGAELSFNEYDVLFNLSRQPERQSRIRDLNRQLLLTQPSVSRLVDRLVSRQLVSKFPDPGDGRGTIVALTDAGFDLFRRVAVIHAESIHRHVGASLTNAELKTLTALTDKLRKGAGELMAGPSIVWLRDDLRLADNPALTAAAERGEPVVLVYVLDDLSDGIRPLGAASRWWLHHSLTALGKDATLVLRRGAAEEVIPALVAETDAGAVFWNRRYGTAREIDARLKTTLRDQGLDARSFQGNLLVEPWSVTTGQGEPYRVFTPFWKAAREVPMREPLPVPSVSWATAASDDLDDWELLPTRPDWAAGLRESWTPGEAGAHELLESFVEERLKDYHRRDEPASDGTSRLSPHLKFGEVSPFQIWQRLHGSMTPEARKNVPKFLSEVGWREFNYTILFYSPEIAEKNYRPAYDAFPWNEPVPGELAAWREGRTGIPLVDAGMRELWHTGTMHNRVRMVVASFLIKNLLIDWRVGENWFWDTLVDADDASNPGNWQWVAGSGADAAPYFRVFNPELQRTKFDPGAEYIRRWVPEFGTPDYPEPMVDLRETRAQALEAYEAVKRAGDRQ